MELVAQIFELFVIPILAILSNYIIQYLKTKSKQIQEETDNDLINKYMSIVSETITKCVIATNQTYVDSLKTSGKFDAKAQQEAFKRTYDSVMLILSDDIKKYVQEATGDISFYLTQLIEAEVNKQKIL